MESSSNQHSKEQGPNWLELPRDVISMILLTLGSIEILSNAQYVCTLWRKICKDPLMWRTINMDNSGELWEMPYDLVKMCKHAVDCSRGQLVDINIAYFGTDELLQYISERSTQLKRLCLVICYDITGQGLIEAIAKFPLLEDLDITLCKNTKPYSDIVGSRCPLLEAVGRYCPRIKSLKVNEQGYKRPHIECDMEALAIADNMPNLRHLQLFGNKLTNVGLQAILDGCPHLESLDLRQCFNVNLGGNLGTRCAEQMKNFRQPYDPTDDCGFTAEIVDSSGSDTEDDYSPDGFSDIELLTDDDDFDNYDLYSGGSDLSDHANWYFD